MQSNQYYQECLLFIRDHLTRFYTHYAAENGLTVAQVSSRASRWDLQQWQTAIKQLDMHDWPDDAFARLKAYNFQIHIDKKHILMALIGLDILRMTVKNQRNIEQRLLSDGQTEVTRMTRAFNLPRTQQKRAYSVITQNKTRSIWSQNLWLDSDSLANDIETLVNKHIKHGMSLNDLENILATHANPAQFKPSQSVADRVKQMEFNARRIVRTESSRLIDEVNMTTYRMQDVKWVEWITEPSACIKCQGIADSGPYRLNEAPLIPDDTHPNCRCSKIVHREFQKLAYMPSSKVVPESLEPILKDSKTRKRSFVKSLLPNAQNVVISNAKFDSYALSFESPRGKDKARVFKSALGYTKENYKEYGLLDQIHKGVLTTPAIFKGDLGHGPRYEVDIPVTGPNNQTHTVLTAWIIDEKGTRLTSAYVKDRKG